MNGESTSTVWPTVGSRTAEEQNRTERNSANILARAGVNTGSMYGLRPGPGIGRLVAALASPGPASARAAADHRDRLGADDRRRVGASRESAVDRRPRRDKRHLAGSPPVVRVPRMTGGRVPCVLGVHPSLRAHTHYMSVMLLKSVEFDDDFALLLSVAGLVMGPQVTSEFEIGGTDSAALRTSRTCLRLCGSCVTGCTSFFRGSDPAI